MEKKTGWHTVNEGGPFKYQKTKNKKGDWTKQGLEGWMEFEAAAGTYHHEHDIILWADRHGDCWGETDVWGILPEFAYWQDRSYKSAYRD